MNNKKINWAVIGLSTMGQNLARNFANNEIPVAVYNRTTKVTRDFIEANNNDNLISAETVAELVEKMESPRKIILLVKAGNPVDELINQLIPLLEKRDIIIDGGNSHYLDTQRRLEQTAAHQVRFIGMGISGGAAGALMGPSLMPSGNVDAVNEIISDLKKIAAKDFGDGSTVTNLGSGSAGHFVKMVHNGIEYAIMQAIAEVYDYYRRVGKLSASEIGKKFAGFNNGAAESYLFEITAKLLQTEDHLSDGYLVDYISDVAESKGTGKWTVQAALDLGQAVPSFAAALFARYQSSQVELRRQLRDLESAHAEELELTDQQIEIILIQTILSSYLQGLELIQAASDFYFWEIELVEICRIWQGGCIIRSKLLEDLRSTIIMSDNFAVGIIKKLLLNKIEQMTQYISLLELGGTPIPVISASHSYIQTLVSAKLPTNLIQAQRDFFGQHGYQRVE